MRFIQSLACTFLLSASLSAEGATLHAPQPKKSFTVGFFNPSSPNNTYWPQVFTVMEEVAKDLGFTFVHYDIGIDNRFAAEQEIKRVLDSSDSPDAIMASVNINNAQRILIATQGKKMPLLFEGPIFPFEMKLLGKDTKTRFPNWLGFFHQNEEEKGYRLAKRLVESARQHKAIADDGKVHIIAVSGTRRWYGTILREKGLERAVKEDPGVILDQVVPSDWTSEKSEELATRMLKRFPEASVVWGASDQIAIGGAAAMKKAGRVLGKQVFVGGMDFSDNGMKHVRDGTLDATVGSPLAYYAKIATFLFDYQNNRKLFDGREVSFQADIHVATRENVSAFEASNMVVKKIDFRGFSLSGNPALKDYDFSWKTLLKSACKSVGENSRELRCSEKPWNKF